MKHNKIVIFALAVLFSVITSYQAEANRTITLQSSSDEIGTIGQIVIEDRTQNKKEVSILAKGLKPEAVYPVWLINMKPSLLLFLKPKMEMLGLGNEDYSFTTDGSGNGEYTARISTEELGSWKLVEIAHHPDGNPKNMKGISSPLQADLQ